MNRLQVKVAIVTGGNSGVGAATAEKFAAEGASVVITARRQAQLDAVAEKIRAMRAPDKCQKERCICNVFGCTEFVERYIGFDVVKLFV